MAHKRFTAHISDRGRFVVPAEARRELGLAAGDLVVIDVEDDSLVVRKAADVAHGFRGYLRSAEPERDLASELIADRREEATRQPQRPTAAKRSSSARR
jgi:AbrB family looped-hinge helix DNA binding protein